MKFIYYLSYLLIFVNALFVLHILKPFQYFDNATSQIVCTKNQQKLDMGWNYIYSFDGRLDDFNDIKARKLCEHNLIKDYGNTLPVPETKNYTFEARYLWDSTWPDTLFVVFAVLVFGFVLIESIFAKHKINRGFKPLIFFLILLVGITIYYFLLKQPVQKIHCSRQTARKINNFKRIIFKYGIFPLPEEESHIQSVLPKLYQSCLRSDEF